MHSGLLSRLLTQLLLASVAFGSAVPEEPNSVVASFGPTGKVKRQTPTKQPVEVCRWWGHGSTQLGDKIYIDGGMQTYHDTKYNFRAGGLWLFMSVSSIDLTNGFKLPLREDDREYTRGGSPNPEGEATIQSALFNDGDSNIYKFGGQFADNNTWPTTRQVTVRPAQLWKFDITQATWEKASFSVVDDKKLVRPAGGAYASAPQINRAYYLGGIVNPRTDPMFEDLPYSGYGVLGDSFLNLDTDRIQFENKTTPGIAPSAYANLVYIETFGKKGVLVFLSGGTAEAEKWLDINGGARARDLSSVHVYDIDSDTWFEQKTTGTPPTGRLAACAAAVPSKDGTSQNIVFYGGLTISSIVLGDTWILSLPSFTWIKVDDSGEKRFEHTCHVVKGNKLLVIGGRDPGQTVAGNPAANYTFDGTNWSCLRDGMVSVMDLNEFTWLDELPKEEQQFLVAKEISDIIGGGPEGNAAVLEPEAGWDDSALAGIMFIDPNRPDPTDPKSDPNRPKEKKGVPIGAIVGGVVGGLAVILAIILAVVCTRRRRRAATAAEKSSDPAAPPLMAPQPPNSPPPVGGYGGYDPRTSMYAGTQSPMSPVDANAAAYWATQGYQYNPNMQTGQSGYHVPPHGPPPAEVSGETAAGYYAPMQKPEGQDEIHQMPAGNQVRVQKEGAAATELPS